MYHTIKENTKTPTQMKAKVHSHTLSFWIADAQKDLAKIQAMPRRKWKFADKASREAYHKCVNGKGYIVNNGIWGVSYNSFHATVQLTKYC